MEKKKLYNKGDFERPNKNIWPNNKTSIYEMAKKMTEKDRVSLTVKEFEEFVKK